jgi:hypothetical protein
MPGPSSLPCARLCRPCVCIDLHIDSIGMKDVTVLLCLLLGVRWVVVADAAVSFSNGVRACVCVWCDTDMDPCCCYLLAVEVEINLSASERVAARPCLVVLCVVVCCCGFFRDRCAVVVVSGLLPLYAPAMPRVRLLEFGVLWCCSVVCYFEINF